MRSTEFIFESTATTLFHVSRVANRNSIKANGLQPRSQEFANIQRTPGIYFLGTLEQADDWGFWFAMDEGTPVDIWQVAVPADYELIEDPHEEMDIYNAYIGYDLVPAANIKLIKTIKKPTSSKNAPPFAKKL